MSKTAAKPFKVACIQNTATPDVDENVAHLISRIREALSYRWNAPQKRPVLAQSRSCAGP